METLRNNSEEKEVEEEKEKKENIRVCKWESVKKRLKGKNQGLCREARTSNVGEKAWNLTIWWFSSGIRNSLSLTYVRFLKCKVSGVGRNWPVTFLFGIQLELEQVCNITKPNKWQIFHNYAHSPLPSFPSSFLSSYFFFN